MTHKSDTKLPPKPTYVAVTYINASVDRVWRALTDPADQATYFGGKTELGEVGEKWIRHATDKWPAIEGVVLAKEPPRRLLITWGIMPDELPPDHVEFLVESAANGTTKFTLRHYHGRAWGEGVIEAASQGWAPLLAGLKTIAETGKPMPSPF